MNRHIEYKLRKIQSYNLRIDREVVTWNYIMDDIRRVGDIMTRQSNLCDEFGQLVKEVIGDLRHESNVTIEKEVYTYVLKMGIRLCEDGVSMLESYSGYQELFSAGTVLVKSGKLDAKGFLQRATLVDNTYKLLACSQGLTASRIKVALDEEAICQNAEYVELTKELAQAYKNMWEKCLKRYKDFFSSPDKGFVSRNQKIYMDIVRGLPQDVVDELQCFNIE